MKIDIDPQIERASTLPGRVYRDPVAHREIVESVLARSWHVVSVAPELAEPGFAAPFVLLPQCLDEPLLLVRDAERELRCLSNVCTHRANLVVDSAGPVNGLRCRYHGRRFDLSGHCQHMPEFEAVAGFPAPIDDLPSVPLEQLGPVSFTSLAPAMSFHALTAAVRERLAWAPWDALTADPTSRREYSVRANWALYCDNYLEGFHIPFVHPELGRALDYGAYSTELLPWGSLQLGIARGDEDTFDVPASSVDHGSRVAAYYFFLFPSTMLNFYPWGLSLNTVQPLGVDSTRVVFEAWVWDANRRERGAGAGLDRVEQEDEEVVENVQRGVRSRLYQRGRYSPTRETGVHHFHRLLCGMLSGG